MATAKQATQAPQTQGVEHEEFVNSVLDEQGERRTAAVLHDPGTRPVRRDRLGDP